MARGKKLPNGIEVTNLTKGKTPRNNLPKFVRDLAVEHGYGDSTVPWSMYVHPDDIDAAFAERAHGNGSACVMAQAGHRLGAQMVYFYRGQAWVDFGSGPVVRFTIPPATYRNVIDPFDNNDRSNVLPGMYPLLPPKGARSLVARRKRNSKRSGGARSKGVNPMKQRQHSERVILGGKVA